MITERFTQAVEFARTAHAGDVRKGTSIPYLSHLLQVSGLVLELGGNEDEAIGGLLHDVAEDAGGEAALKDIREQFGPTVESIVRENSDSITESKTVKAPWKERKAKYLAGVATKSPSALIVSISDKIHNARSLNADSRNLGEAHWSRFKASKEDTIANFRNLLTAFKAREADDPRLSRAIALLQLEVDSLA